MWRVGWSGGLRRLLARPGDTEGDLWRLVAADRLELAEGELALLVGEGLAQLVQGLLQPADPALERGHSLGGAVDEHLRVAAPRTGEVHRLADRAQAASVAISGLVDTDEADHRVEDTGAIFFQ